jgi:cell division septation protein DedD
MARRGSAAGMGYGQAFLLVFGFLVASVVIFLLGTWVGRDLTERRLIQQEPIVRATIPARATPGAAGVDREFYEKVKEQAYKQLETPVETAPPAATPTLPPVPAVTATAVAPTATIASPAIAPTPTAARPAAQGASATGKWSVQVGATTNAREALDMTLKLRTKGFSAFTSQAGVRGQTLYRVRVGRYATREEAREVEARLRRSGEFQGAYVTSE